MIAGIQARLREFTRLLLERNGALVDWPDEAEEGLAMLPPPAAEALKCLEVLPLSHRPDSPLPVNLATDLLERVEPLLQAEPRMASFRVVQLYLKQSSMAEPVARAFAWLNARVRVQQVLPVRTEYHTWYFRAALDSADRWEQVVAVTVNANSGAAVAMPDPFQWDFLQVEPGSHAAGPSTCPLGAQVACARVESASQPFVSRMEAQLGRDRKRLRDYYHALLREDRRRPSRSGLPDEPGKQQAKRQAVELELRRKLAELDERYALRLELAPVALVRLECPALAIQCDVLRKQARRTLTLYWNAVTKELEPVRCHHCGASTFTLAFSGENVQALCPRCHG